LPASDRLVLATIETCWLGEATTGEYATVIPATLPLGEGDTVLGVPDGVADDVAVLVLDALVVALGESVTDAVGLDESDALLVSLGVGEADELDVLLAGVEAAELDELDPLEQAASTNGSATTASVRAGRRPSRLDRAVTGRVSLNGMRFTWLRRSCGARNVRRLPARALYGTCAPMRTPPSHDVLTVCPCRRRTVSA